jgi:hypothetical protein
MATKPAPKSPPAHAAAGLPGVRFGTVRFEGGAYIRSCGSPGWSVQPIPGFGQPIGPPLGMVRVVFDPSIDGPYTVVATALRQPTTPMLCVNCGDLAPDGFVVYLHEPVATHTLQNGGFSFLVLSYEATDS